MQCILIYSRKQRSIETIRQKKKRFRQKKNEIIRQHKYFATNADARDSGYTTSPDIQAQTKNTVTASPESTLTTLLDCVTETKSDSDISDISSLPRNSVFLLSIKSDP